MSRLQAFSFPVKPHTGSEYTDTYLEEGVTFTYIAWALDASGKVIGESKEKSI